MNRLGVSSGLFVFAHVILAVFAMSTHRPDDVHHCKDNDPHCVDKMPVERQNLNALGVFLHEHAGESEDKHSEQHRQADDDVGRVQSDERIERRPKEIGADRQPVLIDQLVPLDARCRP